MNEIRLDKLISQLLNISRSDVKKLIRCGEISVNGNTVTKADVKINPQMDQIIYNGEKLHYKKFVYIMMNKPKDCICSTDDSFTTVLDILPDKFNRKGLFPVGRLDKDTTGLLIITNDGQFAHNVISPNKMVEKRYLVELEYDITTDDEKRLKDGLQLKDGTKVYASFTEILDKNKIVVGITEGKYHQIKRMFGALGNKVISLKRISIGNLLLDENLKTGQSREMTENELSLIFEI